jgi:hypothetical protein
MFKGERQGSKIQGFGWSIPVRLRLPRLWKYNSLEECQRLPEKKCSLSVESPSSLGRLCFVTPSAPKAISKSAEMERSSFSISSLPAIEEAP